MSSVCFVLFSCFFVFHMKFDVLLCLIAGQPYEIIELFVCETLCRSDTVMTVIIVCSVISSIYLIFIDYFSF